MVTVAAQARHVVDRAVRIALSRRMATCIILPSDVQKLEIEEPKHEHGSLFSGPGYAAPVVIPAREDLQRAAAVLNAGKRVAILIGAGAAGAADEVAQAADRLGAGVAKALLGKPVLPDTLPYVTGGIGLPGTRPSYEMMRDCDTLFMIGSTFPYVEFLPKEGSARGVRLAHLLGFDGYLIDAPERIVPMLEAALAARRPAMLEVLADPNVPPLPPHTTAKQAKDYLLALMRGDPDAMGIIRASARQLFG